MLHVILFTNSSKARAETKRIQPKLTLEKQKRNCKWNVIMKQKSKLSALVKLVSMVLVVSMALHQMNLAQTLNTLNGSGGLQQYKA